MLLHVGQRNGTAFDVTTGAAVWATSYVNDFAGANFYDTNLIVNAGMLLTTKDGADGNSNTLIAMSLTDGSLVWQFPAAGSSPPTIEAFVGGFQCSFGDDTSASSSNVCFLSYGCQKTGPSGSQVNCPRGLAPPFAGAKPCGGGKFSPSCTLAVNALTGKPLYVPQGESTPPFDRGGMDAKMVRVGTNVLFDGSKGVSELISMDTRTGNVSWSVPCSGCAEGLLVYEAKGPNPSACDATLQGLCATAKAQGVAKCGMCAGEHAVPLHQAGCSDNQIASWCSDVDQDATVVRKNQTILLVGSDSSLSSNPAVLALDPSSGAQLWNVVLSTKGPINGGRPPVVVEGSSGGGGTGYWNVKPMWAEDGGGGGTSVFLSGVYEDQQARAEQEKQVGERRRVQIPPPPPVTFYSYYTWRVDA